MDPPDLGANIFYTGLVKIVDRGIVPTEIRSRDPTVFEHAL
jgi:hypothetical protein